jgi:hypothetical protein
VDALAMVRRAAEHGEAAFARAPPVIENGHGLAVYQSNLAYLESQFGHEKEALAA